MTRGRLRWLLIAAVVLVVLVAAGIPVYRHVQASRACALTDEQSKAAIGPFGSGPSTLVVGDSWAAAYNLPHVDQGWPAQLAETADRQVVVEARSSTGYVATHCGDLTTMGDRLQVPAGTDTVILEAGLNDVGSPPGQVRAAAEETIAAAVQSGATVVVLGAPTVPARDAAGLAEVNQALRQAAQRNHATFVDSSGWEIELQPDGLHPTTKGAAAFAVELAGAVSG